MTGGSPYSHGVYYDDSYARNLWAPGTKCTNGKPEGKPGADILFDETIDYNMSDWLGGGNGMGRGSINPANLPMDAECKPVYPHQFGRAKLIFEVSGA